MKRKLAVVATTLALLAAGEGIRNWPYFDEAGVLTVCMGETHGVKQSQYYSTAQCWDMLKSRAQTIAAQVEPGLTAPVGTNQSDALISLCYNIGSTACRSSTVFRLHNQGACRAAGEAFLMWKYITVGGKKQVSRGLLKRRMAERDLYIKDCK